MQKLQHPDQSTLLLLQFLTAHIQTVQRYNVNLNVIRLRALLLFLLLGAGSIVAQAQNPPDSTRAKADTTKPKVPLRVATFPEDNFSFGNRVPQDSIHYSLDSFEVVHPFYINTGNLGSPGHLLIPAINSPEPFSVRPDAFGYFGFNRYNRMFYNTNQPYTLLQYFIGQKHEQYVDVLHARNFGDNLNFSFHFLRIRSEGFYLRQNTSNTSVRSNIWFKSPGKHYAMMADVFWTGANVAENGGLADDSTFEFADQLDRQVNDVRLDAAGTVERKRGIWMKHTFAIGKVSDTLVLDSARSYNVITPAWGISLASELYDEKYNYSDDYPAGGFYDVIYRDSASTQDSTYCWRINNSLRLERFNENGATKFRGYLGARHEGGEYWNDTIYSHFQNVFAEGYAHFDFRRAIQPFCSKSYRSLQNSAEASGWYVVSGFNRGNYRADMRGYFSVPAGGLGIHVFTNSIAAPMIYSHYSGNHFRWQNDFTRMTQTGIEAEGTIFRCDSGLINNLELLFSDVSANRPVYFDSTFLPQQLSGSVNSWSAGVKFSLKARWLRSSTRLTYAHTSNDSIYRIPEFIAEESVYADFKLFKSAMQMQAGVDVTWFSQFTAEAYMPAVAQFYLQNSRTVGNYTWISPWISFRIKPVRVFVKAEHVNAGLMGRKYFLLDHYPGNDMALKIGISWLFND